MSDKGRALEDLVSIPTISKEVGLKIAQLEHEFVRTEVEQLRKQIPALRPVYAKRNALVASKELQEADFWPRVFANAPEEVDEFILNTDAAVIGQCLKNLTVERFEVDEQGNGGDPRSVRFIFEFASGDENPYFTNTKLVKEFYYRQRVTKTAQGKRRTWKGYVSAPVRINWKKDQDLTKGFLDAACDLYEAEQKNPAVKREKLPEFEKLMKKIEEDEDENEGEGLTGDENDEADDDNGAGISDGISFFTWFGYRGNDVTAEQSAEAAKEEVERWAKVEKGEEVEEDEDKFDRPDDDDEDESIEEAEIFPDGEGLTVALAEDLWPNALKLYVQSYEDFDDFDDMMDIEELDDDEDDEDNEEEADQPPTKKVKA